jgi:hypothetical protein
MYTSVFPAPPGRLELKKSVLPSSVREGWNSLFALFMPGSGTGGDHGASTIARVDTHRSASPTPPARVEWSMISNPSWRMAGRTSAKGLASSGR